MGCNYWAIMGVWPDRSAFGGGAVEVGSLMKPSILGEGRGRAAGQAGAGGLVNAGPGAKLATGVS